MSEIEVGQRYRDNDPRARLPEFVVEAIQGQFAIVRRADGKPYRIMLRRLRSRGSRGYTPLPADGLRADSLDAAWQEAEAALAEHVAREEDEDDRDGFGVRLDGDAGGYNAYAMDWIAGESIMDHSTQPTRIAALHALASALRSTGDKE